jgi:L-idonate 5-dehydrogenase
MKACVIHAPHDLRIEEAEVPALGPFSVKLRIGAGGICGSDLHYFQHGGFGTVRIKQPMILGHEVAGTVIEIGSAVTRIKLGDRAAINPNQPCGACAQCLAGRANLCLDVRFYGSAMRFPHVQGAFREILVAEERQIFTIPDHVSLGQAAFAEPLAVCLHAVTRASSVAGKRVLVTGVGPIGALTILAARCFGAREIVATDVAALPLKTAERVGADRVIDATTDGLADYGANKGAFDVLLECSGNARALAAGLDVVRPGGTIVQLGLGGEIGLAINTIVTKELELRGSFRFHEEFGWAVDYISRGLIDVAPLLTETIPLAEAQRAFELASDKSQAMKVHLSF